MKKQENIIYSVQNALRILRSFSMNQPELGITEIATKLDLKASTVHRLVSVLAKKGYLEKNESNRRYRLGLTLLGLEWKITTQMELYRESKPFLEKLVEILGETVHIGVLEGNNVVYLHKIECRHPVRLQSSIGKWNPAFCTGTGRAILAYQDEKVINKVLQNELPSFTPNTITNPDEVWKILEKVRQSGYAYSINELHDDVVCIAVPIRDYTDDVIASISIVGLESRIPPNKFHFFIDNLKNAANSISKQLGYFGKEL